MSTPARPRQPATPRAFDRLVDRFTTAAQRGACGVASARLSQIRGDFPSRISDDEHLRRVRAASSAGRLFDRFCGEPSYPDW